MTTLRRLVLMLLVVMLMLLPMATSAYASGSEEAEGFWNYLQQYWPFW